MATGICPFCGKTVDKFIMFRGDIVGCRYCGIHTKQTNADIIRAMSDEELAEFIVRCAEADFFRVNVLGTHSNSTEEWLNWLKQEAEEGE